MSAIYPPEYDEADRTWLESFIPGKMPDGAIIQGYMLVVSYIDPETGQSKWFSHTPMEVSISSCLGLMQMASFDMMIQNTTVKIKQEGDDDEPS